MSARVSQLIRAGKWQDAIDAAIADYAIDISYVNGAVLYDASLAEEGNTTPNRRVRIGQASFRSAGWLASTIAHEVEVHVNRHAMMGRWYTDPEGFALQEVEAYDYEIQNAQRFGLSSNEVNELQNRRLLYHSLLSSVYQVQADAGNYTR